MAKSNRFVQCLRYLAVLGLVAIRLNSTETAVAGGPYYRAPVRDSQRTFQKKVWSWQELKQRNIVMQQRDYSCGAAALATVIKYYWGDDVTEEQILLKLDELLTPEEAEDRVENGLALTDLRRVAASGLGDQKYVASMGTLRFDQLPESKVPLIIGIDVDGYEHFVVFRGFDGEWVYLADPIRGNIRTPGWMFVRQWQENAVLVVAKPNEKPREVSPLSVRGSEIDLGWLNWQVVRTFPSRFRSYLPLKPVGFAP